MSASVSNLPTILSAGFGAPGAAMGAGSQADGQGDPLGVFGVMLDAMLGEAAIPAATGLGANKTDAEPPATANDDEDALDAATDIAATPAMMAAVPNLMPASVVAAQPQAPEGQAPRSAPGPVAPALPPVAEATVPTAAGPAPAIATAEAETPPPAARQAPLQAAAQPPSAPAEPRMAEAAVARPEAQTPATQAQAQAGAPVQTTAAAIAQAQGQAQILASAQAAAPAPDTKTQTPRIDSNTEADNDQVRPTDGVARTRKAAAPGSVHIADAQATAKPGVQAAPVDAAGVEADASPAEADPELQPAPAGASAPPAAAAAAAQAAQPHPVRGAPETVAHLAAQIVKKLDGRTTRFDVALDPIGLGHVDVRVEIGAQGTVSAALTFDNPQAVAELRARAHELQKALEQAGLNLSGGLSFDLASDQGGRGGRGLREDDAGGGFGGRAFQAALKATDAADAGPAVAGYRRRASSGVDVRI